MNNHLLAASDDIKPKSEKERLKEILPALCRPDDPEPKVCCHDLLVVINAD